MCVTVFAVNSNAGHRQRRPVVVCAFSLCLLSRAYVTRFSSSRCRAMHNTALIYTAPLFCSLLLCLLGICANALCDGHITFGDRRPLVGPIVQCSFNSFHCWIMEQLWCICRLSNSFAPKNRSKAKEHIFRCMDWSTLNLWCRFKCHFP